MPSRKISRKDILSAAERIGPEDGVDPRLARKGGDDKPGSRKGLQLARQTARTVSAVLASECNDEVLRDLIVESVTPAPNTSRFLVTVSLAPSAAPVAVEVILERLQRVHGLLRNEVASTITRRKTPDLIFQVKSPS
jgi:ribosome-binding factor A